MKLNKATPATHSKFQCSPVCVFQQGSISDLMPLYSTQIEFPLSDPTTCSGDVEQQHSISMHPGFRYYPATPKDRMRMKTKLVLSWRKRLWESCVFYIQENILIYPQLQTVIIIS